MPREACWKRKSGGRALHQSAKELARPGSAAAPASVALSLSPPLLQPEPGERVSSMDERRRRPWGEAERGEAPRHPAGASARLTSQEPVRLALGEGGCGVSTWKESKSKSRNSSKGRPDVARATDATRRAAKGHLHLVSAPTTAISTVLLLPVARSFAPVTANFTRTSTPSSTKEASNIVAESTPSGGSQDCCCCKSCAKARRA
mmetsp:Transcript_95355/g.273429  ORF Transcript_95355/g.273429 Transcript_95355/m.273429 type:complete len:204 (-) Transcript_95355:1047-1658(-)